MRKSIVMIHGMFCGSWVWNNYKDFYEKKGYSCYSPVLRYHNMHPSDKPDHRLGTTSLLDYAQDLEEFTRKFTHKPLLMGHSMGGAIISNFKFSRSSQRSYLINPCVSKRNKCPKILGC